MAEDSAGFLIALVVFASEQHWALGSVSQSSGSGGNLQGESLRMSEETFTYLLKPNLRSVRRLVQSRLKSSDHTDDVVQQTLLRAFTRREQLRAEAKFKNWLCSIALNEIRGFLRATRPSISLDESPSLELVDRAPSPLAHFEKRERAERLHAGLARLKERERIAIQLVDLNGLTVAEAAGVMAASQAAVKSTHFRARQHLRHALRRTF